MDRKKYSNIILSILFIFLLVSLIWQNYTLSKLNSALNSLDSRIESEFDGTKSMLSYAFRSQEYSILLSRNIESFKELSLYGYYLDGYYGGDDKWCDLSQAIGELNNKEIFQYLSKEDCEMIADFLDEHEYINSPQITEEEIKPILERIEAILQEYSSS